MGIRLISTGTTADSAPSKICDGNPDPRNFRIIASEEHGDYLLAIVQYPDCTNYEGAKVLVFREMTESELRGLSHLDPHFMNGSKLVARFVPTHDGLESARRFCRSLADD